MKLSYSYVVLLMEDSEHHLLYKTKVLLLLLAVRGSRNSQTYLSPEVL